MLLPEELETTRQLLVQNHVPRTLGDHIIGMHQQFHTNTIVIIHIFLKCVGLNHNAIYY